MEVRNTTLDDLAGIIGFSATVRLAAWFGGMNLYVPATVEPGQKIVTLIGESAARRLSEEFGREHIWLPNLSGPLREKRNSEVFHLLVAGNSIREISEKTGLTERRVSQIKAELERLNLMPEKPQAKNQGKKGG